MESHFISLLASIILDHICNLVLMKHKVLIVLDFDIIDSVFFSFDLGFLRPAALYILVHAT